MAVLALLSLVRALKTLGERALKVAERNRDTQLGLLATNLWMIGNRNAVHHKNLESLLGEVEDFLLDSKSPVSGEPSRFATLQAIAKEELPAVELDGRIQTCWKGVRNSHRQRLFDMTEECSKLDNHESHDMSDDSITKHGAPPEYPYDVNNYLYSVLRNHAVCHCRNIKAEESMTSRHCPKLRFNSRFCEPTDGNNNVQLDMMFSSHPVVPTAEIDWREIQVSISYKDWSQKTARSLGGSLHSQISHGQIKAHFEDETEVVGKGGLCSRLIAVESGIRLSFKVSHEQLKCSKKLQPMGRRPLETPGYHLGQVLETHSMRARLRLILAYIIAKSVWQYYNSDWMNTVWTHHYIHFMEEAFPGQDRAVFCKPYLSVEFEETEVSLLEFRKHRDSHSQPVDGVFHRYPIVLALGMMLLEIGLGKRLQPNRPMEWDSVAINSTLADGIKAYSEATKADEWADGCDFPAYKLAVWKCFETSLFQQAPFRRDDPHVDLQERRSILYAVVVHPLEQLLNNTKWIQDAECYVERTPFKRKSPDIAPDKTKQGCAPSLPVRCNNFANRRETWPQKTPRHLNHDVYKVGWICPLEVEQIAAIEMLDEEHEPLSQRGGDTNIYTFGSINNHNIAITGLPKVGNCSAATVITQMRMSFPNLSYVLLVGIGGGVPVQTDNGLVRLGHIVVSWPTGVHSGAVQYDHGKAKTGRFERKGFLAPPPTVLLNAVREVAIRHQRVGQDPIWKTIQGFTASHGSRQRFKFPGTGSDHLYQPDYEHLQAGVSCEEAGCDSKKRIGPRVDDTEPRTVVHRGTIASGELVIKDAKQRDDLARDSGALCFEMEAAGALTDFPCLVIRGISDYCDSHKNDLWHGYAALVAAAYAKQIFYCMPHAEMA